MKVYIVVEYRGVSLKYVESTIIKVFKNEKQAHDFVRLNENECGYREWLEVEEFECE